MYPFTDYVELLCFQDIGLPKDGDTWEGIKIIFTNISMLIYLIMMFVCGCCYGFVETFLFVYLKVYIYILRKGQDDITNQSLKSNPQGNRKLGIPKAGRSISTYKGALENRLKKKINTTFSEALIVAASKKNEKTLSVVYALLRDKWQ